MIDNHNHALYFRTKHILNNLTPSPSPMRRGEGAGGDGVRCIHIDQYSDLAKPPLSLQEYANECNYSSDIFCKRSASSDLFSSYTTHTCNVGNFIQPALQAGLISEYIWLRNQYYLDSLTAHIPPLVKGGEGRFILDIDLDFRAPEMDTDLATSKPLLIDLLHNASLVTIATSPYFLDQQHAIDLLHQLFT